MDTQDPQPQLWTQPQADNPLPEAMEHENPQGDPNLPVLCSHLAAVTLVRAASPPHLQVEPQAYAQGPSEPSQTQQSLEVASQDMVIADSEPDGWQMDTDAPNFDPDSPMPTGSALPTGFRGGNDVWLGVGVNYTNYSHTDYVFHGGNPIGSYVSLDLGGGEEDGATNGGVVGATPSPTRDSPGAWGCSMF
jgi:hypothetical protein